MSDNLAIPEPPNPGELEPLSLAIQAVAKDACLIVFKADQPLPPEASAHICAMLTQMRIEFPDLPPMVLLPHGMTVEAYLKEQA